MHLPRLLHAALRSSSSRPTPTTITRQCLRITATSVFQQRSYAAAAPTPTDELKKTPLYDLHVAHGGKMVPFAGYAMPVLYSDQGVGESHRWVRERAGLFDVSHMVQRRITGPGALPFLHTVTPSDLTTLSPNQSTLSVLLHPVTGGIVDDLIITLESPNSFYIVTNAACKDKDSAYLTSQLSSFLAAGGEKAEHGVIENSALVALQGPAAAAVLGEYLRRRGSAFELNTLFFGEAAYVAVGKEGEGELRIARGGYTGEDGFEIAVSDKGAEELVGGLLETGGAGRVKMAGLGARDSLRLEAGMCLYGHDIDDTTTPIEAGLKWVVAKRRVLEGNFNGAEIISRQYADWGMVTRRRVGLLVDGAPAREGAEVLEKGTEKVVGRVTSGCPSPTLGKNVAMGYVQSGFHKVGTEVGVVVRGKVRVGRVARMPFVETRYVKA